MEWLDGDDENFWSDWEDEEDSDRSDWREFIVSMRVVDKPGVPTVTIRVFASDFDHALTCGEVLTAVYFNA
jgi:hypothetical protein